MTPKQRHRYKIKKIWADNVGSTGDRDTDFNTYQGYYNISDAYAAGLYRQMYDDIIL